MCGFMDGKRRLRRLAICRSNMLIWRSGNLSPNSQKLATKMYFSMRTSSPFVWRILLQLSSLCVFLITWSSSKLAPYGFIICRPLVNRFTDFIELILFGNQPHWITFLKGPATVFRALVSTRRYTAGIFNFPFASFCGLNWNGSERGQFAVLWAVNSGRDLINWGLVQ